MRRQERRRLYEEFAANGGASPERPKRQKKPIIIEPDEDDDPSPTYDRWNIEPGDSTMTLEVTPDGIHRATRRTREGNYSALVAQAESAYRDHENDRAIRRQMAADKQAHDERMERMRNDFRLSQEALKAHQKSLKHAAQVERERNREEREFRIQQDRRRLEQQRWIAAEEAERRAREEQERRSREKAQRRAREAELAARESERNRDHDYRMTVLGNIDGVVNTLTDARIKQARAIMQQAEDRLRFHDQRVQQYAGKINVAREQRGERFDKELALVFAQFGLNPPDVESMMEPSMTNLVQLHAQKRKSYVGSRLLTGVSTVHEDETGGYVEFVDGQRVDLPGADEGYTVYVHRLTPYVIVIHINKFTAEYLKSLGYKTSKGPFDCCKTPFGCIIQ